MGMECLLRELHQKPEWLEKAETKRDEAFALCRQLAESTELIEELRGEHEDLQTRNDRLEQNVDNKGSRYQGAAFSR